LWIKSIADGHYQSASPSREFSDKLSGIVEHKLEVACIVHLLLLGDKLFPGGTQFSPICETNKGRKLHVHLDQMKKE